MKLKKQCVIEFDGLYMKRIESHPLFGRAVVWVSDINCAMVFNSKACAKDILQGYWFDSIRYRCHIISV